MIKKISWILMTVLALGVAGYALVISLVPDIRPPFVKNIYFETPISAIGHFVGGGLALAVGAFQVNARIRSRFLNIHRLLGRVYVVTVFFGGLSAFLLALNSFGGLVTHFGFGMLAICWIGSTITAFRYIRNGNIDKHQDWMIRSYALTLAAVTLRIYLPVSQMAGIPFETAYSVISWFCWVPNILVVEWFLLAQIRKPMAEAETV